VKTAVSIPDDVFEQAEELARRRNMSRSELYATALRALLSEDAGITEQLDGVYANDDTGIPDPAVSAAARRTFAASDW
jgi:predicted transcriptional regulator